MNVLRHDGVFMSDTGRVSIFIRRVSIFIRRVSVTSLTMLPVSL